MLPCQQGPLPRPWCGYQGTPKFLIPQGGVAAHPDRDESGCPPQPSKDGSTCAHWTALGGGGHRVVGLPAAYGSHADARDAGRGRPHRDRRRGSDLVRLLLDLRRARHLPRRRAVPLLLRLPGDRAAPRPAPLAAAAPASRGRPGRGHHRGGLRAAAVGAGRRGHPRRPQRRLGDPVGVGRLPDPRRRAARADAAGGAGPIGTSRGRLGLLRGPEPVAAAGPGLPAPARAGCRRRCPARPRLDARLRGPGVVRGAAFPTGSAAGDDRLTRPGPQARDRGPAPARAHRTPAAGARHRQHGRRGRDRRRHGGPGGAGARADLVPAGRAAAHGGRARRGSRRGAGGLPRQVVVPGDDEPRDPHPHERCHRVDRSPAVDRPRRATAGVRARRPHGRRRAAGDHQRHPGLLQGRGRRDGHRGHRLPAQRGRRRRRGDRGRAGPRPRP